MRENNEEITEQLENLNAALELAREKLSEQDTLLRQLTSLPFSHATVVALNREKKSVAVSAGNQLLDVNMPFDAEMRELLTPGGDVLLNMQTMQIVQSSNFRPGGDTAAVRKVIDDTFVEVDYQSSSKVVFRGMMTHKLEKGDQVVLDQNATIVVRNLGKDKKFVTSSPEGITWDDIGGLDAAKEALIEAVELPQRRPDLFKFYGKKPPSGILLYGPPGCGKTMLGKATATAIAKAHRGDGSGFLYMKGPEILDRYVGVAESAIRQTFQWARKYHSDHGYPAVLFIDEADAILSKRGSGVSSDIERTIVPMFLTEMSGMEDSGAIVILATNRADILDPAVTREGRIDRKIKVDRPNLKSAESIFEIHLKGVPFNNGFTIQELSRCAAEDVFSPDHVLYEIRKRSGDIMKFTLANLIHGGMIAGIVDRATSIALQRDLTRKDNKKTGVKKDDITVAVRDVFLQNKALGHTDELSEFVHDFRDEIVGIQKLHQGYN